MSPDRTPRTVYDNGSADNSLEPLSRFADVRVVPRGENYGYAGAANLGIRESASRFVLILSPDVTLAETFLGILVRAARAQPQAGRFTGKLLCATDGAQAIIDSTGRLLLNRWALNRDEAEVDWFLARVRASA